MFTVGLECAGDKMQRRDREKEGRKGERVEERKREDEKGWENLQGK